MTAVRLVFQPPHPSTDWAEALSDEMWEALAVCASELVATSHPQHLARLTTMGLVGSNGYPTAAGFALLLSWHRKWRTRDRWWRALTRHERRMRILWSA